MPSLAHTSLAARLLSNAQIVHAEFGQGKKCVESRCGALGLGAAYPLPALSAGASIAAPYFRFRIPLIEPDGPVSGIRLSRKGSRCRPREIARPLGQADQAQHFVQ